MADRLTATRPDPDPRSHLEAGAPATKGTLKNDRSRLCNRCEGTVVVWTVDVPGLLCTWAQHTSQAVHDHEHCGLSRPRRHPRLPEGRGQGPPEACVLAAGITPAAAAAACNTVSACG